MRLPDITTAPNWELRRRDFHPQVQQLVSLHVLVEAPVEDVVGCLDRPVPAIEGEQPLRGCGLHGQAGDAVGGLAAALAGLDLDGVAAHGEDLPDAGEVEVVVEFAGDPDGAPFAATVLGLRALVGEVRPALGDDLVEQEADIVMQARLVAPAFAGAGS